MWCVEGSYAQKEKGRTKDFESCLVIVWAIDVNEVIYEGYKRSVEEHCRSYFILSFAHVDTSIVPLKI